MISRALSNNSSSKGELWCLPHASSSTRRRGSNLSRNSCCNCSKQCFAMPRRPSCGSCLRCSGGQQPGEHQPAPSTKARFFPISTENIGGPLPQAQSPNAAWGSRPHLHRRNRRATLADCICNQETARKRPQRYQCHHLHQHQCRRQKRSSLLGLPRRAAPQRTSPPKASAGCKKPRDTRLLLRAVRLTVPRREARLAHMLKATATMPLAIVELETNALPARRLSLQEELFDVTLAIFSSLAIALAPFLAPTITVQPCMALIAGRREELGRGSQRHEKVKVENLRALASCVQRVDKELASPLRTRWYAFFRSSCSKESTKLQAGRFVSFPTIEGWLAMCLPKTNPTAGETRLSGL